MISSQLHQQIEGFDELIEEGDSDFQQSGLKKTSVVRISRLAIVEGQILEGRIGRSVLIGCSGYEGGSRSGFEEARGVDRSSCGRITRPLQLKMGVGRFQARSARRVRLRGPRVTTPANGNFAGRGRFVASNSVGPFPVHFS
jgi:hypothetical protein